MSNPRVVQAAPDEMNQLYLLALSEGSRGDRTSLHRFAHLMLATDLAINAGVPDHIKEVLADLVADAAEAAFGHLRMLNRLDTRSQVAS